MGLARDLVKDVGKIAVGIAGDSAKMLSAFFRMIDPEDTVGVGQAVDSVVDGASNVAKGVVDTTVDVATGASDMLIPLPTPTKPTTKKTR